MYGWFGFISINTVYSWKWKDKFFIICVWYRRASTFEFPLGHEIIKLTGLPFLTILLNIENDNYLFIIYYKNKNWNGFRDWSEYTYSHNQSILTIKLLNWDPIANDFKIRIGFKFKFKLLTIQSQFNSQNWLTAWIHGFPVFKKYRESGSMKYSGVSISRCDVFLHGTPQIYFIHTLW